MGERGVRLVLRSRGRRGAQGQGHGRRAHASARGLPDPAQRLGRRRARDDAATEDYAYAATLALARAIADRAGEAGLRAVWADASAHIGAYQPPDPSRDATSIAASDAVEPEKVDGPPDWRGLLDLLDAHSATSFDDLWRTWVARDADLDLLDARKAARTQYDEVVTAAGDWRLPRAVRDAMRAWRFDQAGMLLGDAATILGQRSAIAAGVAASGLTAPDTLRTAFESPDGFASATLEATAELETIRRYETAAAARPATPDAVQSLGLWGATPDGELDRARALFAIGDLAGSATAAGSAASTWSSAADIGRGRLISIVVLALVLLFAIVLFAAWLRGRRRRARAAADAVTSGGIGVGPSA